ALPAASSAAGRSRNPGLPTSALSTDAALARGIERRQPQVQRPGSGAEVPGSQSANGRFPQMKVQVTFVIVSCTVMVNGQTGSSPAHKTDEKQPATGLYQRQVATRPHE